MFRASRIHSFLYSDLSLSTTNHIQSRRHQPTQAPRLTPLNHALLQLNVQRQLRHQQALDQLGLQPGLAHLEPSDRPIGPRRTDPLLAHVVRVLRIGLIHTLEMVFENPAGLAGPPPEEPLVPAHEPVFGGHGPRASHVHLVAAAVSHDDGFALVREPVVEVDAAEGRLAVGFGAAEEDDFLAGGARDPVARLSEHDLLRRTRVGFAFGGEDEAAGVLALGGAADADGEAQRDVAVAVGREAVDDRVLLYLGVAVELVHVVIELVLLVRLILQLCVFDVHLGQYGCLLAMGGSFWMSFFAAGLVSSKSKYCNYTSRRMSH